MRGRKHAHHFHLSRSRPPPSLGCRVRTRGSCLLPRSRQDHRRQAGPDKEGHPVAVNFVDAMRMSPKPSEPGRQGSVQGPHPCCPARRRPAAASASRAAEEAAAPCASLASCQVSPELRCLAQVGLVMKAASKQVPSRLLRLAPILHHHPTPPVPGCSVQSWQRKARWVFGPALWVQGRQVKSLAPLKFQVV